MLNQRYGLIARQRMPTAAVECYLKAVLVRSGEGDAVVTAGGIAEATFGIPEAAIIEARVV